MLTSVVYGHALLPRNDETRSLCLVYDQHSRKWVWKSDFCNLVHQLAFRIRDIKHAFAALNLLNRQIRREAQTFFFSHTGLSLAMAGFGEAGPSYSSGFTSGLLSVGKYGKNSITRLRLRELFWINGMSHQPPYSSANDRQRLSTALAELTRLRSVYIELDGLNLIRHDARAWTQYVQNDLGDAPMPTSAFKISMEPFLSCPALKTLRIVCSLDMVTFGRYGVGTFRKGGPSSAIRLKAIELSLNDVLRRNFSRQRACDATVSFQRWEHHETGYGFCNKRLRIR